LKESRAPKPIAAPQTAATGRRNKKPGGVKVRLPGQIVPNPEKVAASLPAHRPGLPNTGLDQPASALDFEIFEAKVRGIA